MTNSIEASITGGTTTADDNVTVIATAQFDLFGIVGTISGGGTAGIGGSVTINTFSNVTKAFITGGAVVTGKGNAIVSVPLADGSGGTEDIRGVGVIATEDNEIDIITANLSGGGTAGIAATVSVSVVEDEVQAYIDGSTVNPSNGAHNVGQGVRVRALDLMDLDVKAGGLAFGGTAGVGATTDVQIVGNTVKAYITNGANVRARTGGVLVTAYSDETMDSITMTGAGGGSAGVAGNVPIMSVGSTTEAHVTSSTINTTGDLRVIADSELRIGDGPLTLFAGAIAAGGAAGVGASVVVVLVKPITKAHISNSVTDASGTTEVRADSLETLTTISVAGGFGGYVGVGGALIVSSTETTTQAYIDGPSVVNAVLGGGAQDVVVHAIDSAVLNENAGSAAAGIVGVAASINVLTLKNATVAYIGSGASVAAGRDVSVLATQHRDVTSLVIGLGGGLVGLQGSISVVNIGSNFTAAGKDALPSDGQSDDASLSGLGAAANEQANGSSGSKVGTLAGSDATATSATSRANGKTGSIDLSGDFATGAPAALGTSASILGSVTAGRDIIVEATDTTELTITAGAIAGGVVGIGVAVTVANIDTNTEAFIGGNGTLSSGRDVKVRAAFGLNGSDDGCSLGSLDDCMARSFAGGGGLVAVFGSVIVIEDNSVQTAYIAGSTHIVQAASIQVRAESDRHINLLTGELAGGLVAAGAAVAVAGAGGATKAWIGGSAQIGKSTGTVGSLLVHADSDTQMDVNAVAISAGFIGAGANVAEGTIEPTIQAYIDGSAQVETTGSVTVEAISMAVVDDDGIGVSIGAGAVGLSIVTAEILSTVTAYIGGSANVGAGTSLTIRARHNADASGADVAGKKADAFALASAGGIAAVGISTATATASADLDSYVDSGATINASGDVQVLAFTNNDAHAETTGVTGGAFSAGAFLAFATAAGAARARMDGTLTDAGNITVFAKSDFDAFAKVFGATIGAIAIDGMDAESEVGGLTRARVNGDILDGGSLTVRSRTSNSATTEAQIFNLSLLGGATGAFARSEITGDADNEATIGSSASITVGGAVTVDAGQDSENLATSKINRLGTGLFNAGVLVVEAVIDSSVSATMDGDVDATSLSVTAAGVNHTNAVTTMVTGGAIAFSGAGTLAEIGEGADVRATVGSGASIQLGGQMTVGATSTNTAFADSNAASGGIVAASVTLPTAHVSGATEAQLDGDVSGATTIGVTATSTNTATTTPEVLTVGGIALAGTAAEAKVLDGADTQATVGATALLGASSAITVKADAHNHAKASVTSASLSVVSIQVMLPTAEVRGDTNARLDGSVASSGGVLVESVAENWAEAETTILSITLAGASGAVATAQLTGDVEAGIGGGSIASTGEVKVWAHLQGAHQNTADATAKIGAGALFGSIAVAGAIARITGAVRATEAATISSSNKVTVLAEGADTATATTKVLAVGIGFAGAGAGADAEISSPVQRWNGTDWVIVPSGPDLPGSPSVGFVFRLTRRDGTTNPGVYRWNGASWVAQSVGTGSTFPSSPAVGTLFVLDAPVIEARVDGGSIMSTGAVLVKANGTFNATAVSDVGAGGIIAIAAALPSAVVEAGVKALLDGDVTGATAINVEAYGSRLAKSTSEAVSVGLGAVRAGRAESTIGALSRTDAIVGSNSDVNTPTAAIVVKSNSTNDAQAYISSHTLGAVSVTITSPTAEIDAPTTAQLNGNVGTTTTGIGADGVSGTLGVPGAGSISVTAAAVDHAAAKVITLTVGLISVNPSSSTAVVAPTVSAKAGSGHVAASGNVEYIAESHTDADANTDSSGGGAISVQDLISRVDDDPTVTVTVAGGLIQAGGTLTIRAIHGKLPPVLSDGTIQCVNFGGGDGSTCGAVAESINFEKPHGLITGDTVVYEANGLITGLTNKARYPVIVTGPNGFRLGAQFVADDLDGTGEAGEASIDLDRGTIVFAFDHNLLSGELVRYEADGASLPASPGLVAGQLYEVVVVDARRIKLKLPGAASVDVTPSSQITPGTDTITILSGHGFTQNQAVTYHAPVRLKFLEEGVDVQLAPKSGVFVISRDDSGAINHSATANNIYLGTHGLGNGNIVQYTTDGVAIACTGGSDAGGQSGCVGGRLVNGGYYKVMFETNQSIQLANLTSCSPTCTAINIVNGNGASGTHSIVRAGEVSMGPTDGNTYWVQVLNPTQFKLRTRISTDPAGTIVDLVNQITVPAFGGLATPLSIGGTHTLERVIGFTGASVGGTVHRLVIDLASDGGGVMVGVGGPKSLIGSSSDEVSTASSSGFGVGAIAVRVSKSNANALANVSTTISGGTLRANDVVISASSIVNIAFVSANAGGGFIDVGDSTANGSITNNVTTTIASTANVVAGRDVKVTAGGLESGNGESTTDGGGAIGFASGDTSLTVNYAVKVSIAGRVYAFRTLFVESRDGMDLRDKSGADTGGLGADADADDDTDKGIHVSGVIQTRLESSARLIGANVYLSASGGQEHDLDGLGGVVNTSPAAAIVTGYKAAARSDADATALGADSDAAATVVISDLTEVFLDTASEITSFDRTDLRAKHENADLHATAHANCDCGGGDTDATAKLDYNSTARVVGRDTSIIRTAYLWLEAFQDPVNDHYTRSADSDGGLLDGGSESSPGSTNRFRSFHWESTVILLGEPNPVLVIDSTGTIANKTRNVQVRAYNPVTHTYSGLLGVGDQIPVNQWIVVGDLLYDETGFVHFEANDTSPDSKIIGNAGEFQIKDTWDSVTITNASNRRLVVNDINVVSTANDPEIQIAVDNIPFPNPGPSFGNSLADPLGEWAGGLAVPANDTFDFALIHKFAPTFVQVRNEGPATPSDIWLDGPIENPIGHTYVKNERGGIFSDNSNDLDGIESLGVDVNHVATFDRPGRRHRLRADPDQLRRARRRCRIRRATAGRRRTARSRGRRGRPVQAHRPGVLPRWHRAGRWMPVRHHRPGRGGRRPGRRPDRERAIADRTRVLCRLADRLPAGGQ